MRRQIFKKQTDPTNVPLSLPSQSPFEKGELPSHRHGSFRIPVPGLLNSVSNRAAQGQDAGSAPRQEQGIGKRTDACSPPSRSPAPTLQGQASPSEPRHWDVLQGGGFWLLRAPGSLGCTLQREGERRQMSLIQGEGQCWHDGKAACALCQRLETFLKIHCSSVFLNVLILELMERRG